MDETEMRVLSKNYWLRTFRTPNDEVVVAIRPSRSGNVLHEFFSARTSMVRALSMAGVPIISSWSYNDVGHI